MQHTIKPVLSRQPLLFSHVVVRRFIMPLVFLLGFYGLVRYAMTGEGATAGSFGPMVTNGPAR